jgi:hypothetical protein
VSKKEAENILKYRGLKMEIQHTRIGERKKKKVIPVITRQLS